jgi:hypothetical protein
MGQLSTSVAKSTAIIAAFGEGKHLKKSGNIKIKCLVRPQEVMHFGPFFF